ncbi:mushroom body large-type Kenyon cell-specific protein 1-like [Drosophila nasuta]|uniref:mushroom body large-type Kenyon cell-specific protein 1-like n=1 Tax=Drosophila nasuta TaxID=42062 RepID=UPI00295E8E61|nr:mushroom body large-type Kenyon cell-specific protein 1-like [Drosophila nasuta]
MSAHKEAAKQRKRKSLKMALEKCMQRRDAMACTEVAGGEQGGVMGIAGGAGEMGETTTTTTTATAAAAAAAAAAATAAAAAGLLSFEHQEIAMQIKAAMAAEQQQRERAEAEAEAEAEAMDTTANTTANTTATTTTSTTTATTTTTTGETSTTTDEGSDAEAEAELSGNEALPKATAMDIDEPESELVVVEPKIEPLSDSEPEDEEDDELLAQQQQQQQHYAAAAVMPIDEPVEMQRTPTSTPTSQMLMMAHEAPALTSTPKVNVDVNEQ